MTMFQDGVEVMVLPDSAHCELDADKRNPLDMDDCPIGEAECSGDCRYYSEEDE